MSEEGLNPLEKLEASWATISSLKEASKEEINKVIGLNSRLQTVGFGRVWVNHPFSEQKRSDRGLFQAMELGMFLLSLQNTSLGDLFVNDLGFYHSKIQVETVYHYWRTSESADTVFGDQKFDEEVQKERRMDGQLADLADKIHSFLLGKVEKTSDYEKKRNFFDQLDGKDLVYYGYLEVIHCPVPRR